MVSYCQTCSLMQEDFDFCFPAACTHMHMFLPTNASTHIHTCLYAHHLYAHRPICTSTHMHTHPPTCTLYSLSQASKYQDLQIHQSRSQNALELWEMFLLKITQAGMAPLKLLGSGFSPGSFLNSHGPSIPLTWNYTRIITLDTLKYSSTPLNPVEWHLMWHVKCLLFFFLGKNLPWNSSVFKHHFHALDIVLAINASVAMGIFAPLPMELHNEITACH